MHQGHHFLENMEEAPESERLESNTVAAGHSDEN